MNSHLRKAFIVIFFCLSGLSPALTEEESLFLTPTVLWADYFSSGEVSVSNASSNVGKLHWICRHIKRLQLALSMSIAQRIETTQDENCFEACSLAYYSGAAWVAYTNAEINTLIDNLKESYTNHAQAFGLMDTQFANTWPPYVYTDPNPAIAVIEYRPDFGLPLETNWDVFIPMLELCDLSPPAGASVELPLLTM